MAASLHMAKSLNLDKKKTQRILPASDPVDFSSLSPDEAMMLKEELAIATSSVDPRHLWFAAQEQSGPLPRSAVAPTKEGDRALRLQLYIVRHGGQAKPVVKDTAFGMLTAASAVLGLNRA